MRLTGAATILWRLGPDSCSTRRFFPSPRNSILPPDQGSVFYRPDTGAGRQLPCGNAPGTVKAVVKHTLAETYEGLDVSRQAQIAG